jgi:hypothetical protein
VNECGHKRKEEKNANEERGRKMFEEIDVWKSSIANAGVMRVIAMRQQTETEVRGKENKK